MIDLAQNLNRLGPPKGATELAMKLIGDSISAYPDVDGHGKGRMALAVDLGIDPCQVGFGVGSTEIFRAVNTIFHPREAIILAPTFWEYEFFCRESGLPIRKVTAVEKNGFRHNLNDLSSSLHGGEVVFLCNVNNPTSVLTERDELVKLATDNPLTQFVIDETYLYFRQDFALQSLAKLATKVPNVHVVISFSKFYSLAGLRVGALISDGATVDTYLKKGRVQFSTSDVVQGVLEFVLGDESFREKSRLFYREQSERFIGMIGSDFRSQMYAFPADGPFVLVKILKHSSVDVTRHLANEGVLVRGGHELGDVGACFVRVAVCTAAEQNAFAASLFSYFSNVGDADTRS